MAKEVFKMKSECKPKKSLIGGFAGGLIGCLAGIIFQSDWLAMILFFVFGFIGYDFKEFFAVSIKVFKHCSIELKDFIVSCWEDVKPFGPYLILFLVLIPIFFIYCFAFCNDGAHLNKHFFENALDYFSANWTWIHTGHNPMHPASETGTSLSRFVTACIVVPGSLIISCFLSAIVAITLFAFVWCVKQIPETLIWCRENYAKTPIALAIFAIYVTFGPIVILFKALGLIAIGIHSFRRMACGLSTLAGGIIYMAFVPFKIGAISLGIQAIVFALGCGLVCGLLAAGVDLALDGEKVKNKLDAFMKLSIYKALPAKIKF